jgi:hypothetical protein
LHARVIELVLCVLAAVLVGWLVRRRRQRRADVVAGLVRKPAFGRREVALPGGLRRARVRAPSVREAVGVDPGSRIVPCVSADGEIPIAVMPEELDHVIRAAESA